MKTVQTQKPENSKKKCEISQKTKYWKAKKMKTVQTQNYENGQRAKI